MSAHSGEREPHDFVPISSVYQPIGLLYRPIAADTCQTCGQRKANHSAARTEGSDG